MFDSKQYIKEKILKKIVFSKVKMSEITFKSSIWAGTHNELALNRMDGRLDRWAGPGLALFLFPQ